MPNKDPAAALREVMSSLTLDEQRDLLDHLMVDIRAAAVDLVSRSPIPTLSRAPRRVRGLQFRIDLLGTKPPVWRRVIVPGSLTLSETHAVIQGAMGWTNSHLHRFRVGSDPLAPHFVTEFDLEEGDVGILETDVRLDQLVTEVGDRLWYEYDFGDGWDHVLRLEQIHPDPPPEIAVVTGRRACPPEDVGGVGGYEAVTRWVDSGFDERLLPTQFEDTEQGRHWLPIGWQPAAFDLAQAAEDVAAFLQSERVGRWPGRS